MRTIMAIILLAVVAILLSRAPSRLDMPGPSDRRAPPASTSEATDGEDARVPQDVRTAGATPRVPPTAEPAAVTSITDGDTLRVDVDGRNEPVRLLAIDTPEVSGDCGATAATEALAALAPVGSTVWLEADAEGRDRYGRLLRYVWRPDGVLVNRALVRQGMARARLYPPNDGRWTTIRRAGAQAQQGGAGLWQRCGWTDDDGAVPPPAKGTVGCDPNYTGCVPPYPPDVDCGRVDGPVTVLGADPHHLDGDGDRRACEPPPG